MPAKNNKQALILLLQQQYPDYQPVIEMAEAAMALSKKARTIDKLAGDDGRATLVDANGNETTVNSVPVWKEASAAHDRVAAYLVPKLKSVEYTSDDGETPAKVFQNFLASLASTVGPPGSEKVIETRDVIEAHIEKEKQANADEKSDELSKGK